MKECRSKANVKVKPVVRAVQNQHAENKAESKAKQDRKKQDLCVQDILAVLLLFQTVGNDGRSREINKGEAEKTKLEVELLPRVAREESKRTMGENP